MEKYITKKYDGDMLNPLKEEIMFKFWNGLTTDSSSHVNNVLIH